MLTLDALARMADRMPSEPNGAAGSPPFRNPDPGRTREVRLPTVVDETRLAQRLFGFFVAVALVTLVPTGVLVTHALDLYQGHLALGDVLRTAFWFLLATLLLVVPLAGIGLTRELARFRRARRLLGEEIIIDPTGLLRSGDGSASYQL